MIEIELGMDYLFDARRVNKLQFHGKGILNDDDAKSISEFKFQDGCILHRLGEIDEPLCVYDLEEDMGVEEYIEADEELSNVLNDNEPILFAEYKEI